MFARINQRIKRTDAYRRYKHSAAYVTLKEWQKDLRRKFNLSKYRGSDYRCPVCGIELSAFKPGAGSYVKMARQFDYVYPLAAIETFNIEAYACPSCDASDRERLCALYLDGVLAALDRRRRRRVIEFAPSFGLPRKLKSYPFVDYRSADLFRNNVDDRIDISDMCAYTDASVDIVLCSHVLEHVPDDRRAMRELHRILRDDGFAVVMVPLVHGVDETHEDAALDTPALRWKYYGSDDHVRQYGKRDFIDRLTASGFAVEQLGVGFFGAEAFRRAGIAADSILYVARKGPSGSPPIAPSAASTAG